MDYTNATTPSRDSQLAKVRRMIRPELLKKDEPLVWSVGQGTDVWDMFCAAIVGDMTTIERLLEKDPALVRGAYDYRTPLTFAVRENQLAIAAYLLEHGADPVNSGTSDTLLQMARDRGFTEMQALLERALTSPEGVPPRGGPVAAAIREHDLHKVRALLDANPELLHAADERGSQPIHWAVMSRQPDVIDELLAHGADIEATRPDGSRPIQLTNGDYNYRGWRDVPKDWPITPDAVYRHLLSKGAYLDIGMASAKGDLERVRQLLAEDPGRANRVVDYGSYYSGCGAPIKNAALMGHIEIVKLLLDHGADPNLPEEGVAPRGHALYAAASNGHYDVAKLLLERGAYPNAEVESSADTLSRAIMNADQKMIDLLCSYGAARALHIVAYYGDVREAAAMLAANPVLADNPTALEDAAGQGHEPIVRLMLRYQPDLPKRIAVGMASQGPQDPVKSRELAELLFDHGMNANHADWLRITPLHRFASRGDLENVALFLDHGADIHARDEELSSTPLGYAAKHGQTEMVAFLLERGAKPHLADDPPWATPLAWATRRGHTEVIALLRRHE